MSTEMCSLIKLPIMQAFAPKLESGNLCKTLMILCTPGIPELWMWEQDIPWSSLASHYSLTNNLLVQ